MAILFASYRGIFVGLVFLLMGSLLAVPFGACIAEQQVFNRAFSRISVEGNDTTGLFIESLINPKLQKRSFAVAHR